MFPIMMIKLSVPVVVDDDVDEDVDDDDDDDDDRFYTALFSALEQTHCAFVACDSKSVTSFLN